MLISETERVQLHAAFVLHYRPYRDSSLLLDVLTEHHGRISLIAKGAKQEKSKFRGCTQPFQRLSLSWVRKLQLATLVDAEVVGKPLLFVGEEMYAALYLNELLSRVLIHDEPVNDIFHAYADALKQLNQVGISAALRAFEFSLLQSLGFEIQLDHDAAHAPISADLHYKYIPEHGFVVSREKNVYLFNGRHIIGFRDKHFSDPNVLKVAQRLMRVGLHKLIGDKPLKSRELFRAYRQMRV